MKSSLKWKKIVEKRANFLIPEDKIKGKFFVEIFGVIYQLKATFFYQATMEKCFQCGASQGYFTHNQKRILTRISNKMLDAKTNECLETSSSLGKVVARKLLSNLRKPLCEKCLSDYWII